MKNVYVTIGNSDDKLTQSEWYEFCYQVNSNIRTHAKEIYGEFYSASKSRYQNACWSFAITDNWDRALKEALNVLREDFRQDSVAWAEAEVEFI